MEDTIVDLYPNRERRGTYFDFFDGRKYKTIQEAYDADDYVKCDFVKNRHGILFVKATHTKYNVLIEEHRLINQNPLAGIGVLDDRLISQMADRINEKARKSGLNKTGYGDSIAIYPCESSYINPCYAIPPTNSPPEFTDGNESQCRASYLGCDDKIYSSPKHKQWLDIVERFNLDFLVGSAVKHLLSTVDSAISITDLNAAREYLDIKIKQLENKKQQ